MGYVSGKKGESVFAEPLLRYFRHNPLPELFGKLRGVEDHRLVAIVTALIVENRLDELNAAFLPKYEFLVESADFSFSAKINLARALQMIPPKILRVADMVRQIRNEFAHNLNLRDFDKLPRKRLSLIDSLATDVFIGRPTPPDEPADSPKARFSALGFYCIVGLDAYGENLRLLRQRIEDEAFLTTLIADAKAEEEARLEATVQRGPVSVEVGDGVRVERFENGLVRIISLGEGPV